ncbi:MAG TPA: hypothetical protein VKG78_09280 [Opitutaceae bacterium]|nr:hypothetical protein [Opitutaceae bacterium]
MCHPNLAVLAVLSATVALACAVPLRADLAQASPFLPPPGSAAPGAQAGPSGPVELRGIMSTPAGAAYCIYDTAKKTSAWVGLNEAGNDFVVKAADPDSDSVTVDFQGRSLRLVLRTAKVASAGAGGSGVAPAASPSSPVVLNPSAADEQRRLDAVSQEVRRRRLEREKAAQAARDTGQAPVNGPPPVPNR